MKATPANIIIVAPDTFSGAVIQNALKIKRITPRACLTPTTGWEKQARKEIDDGTRPILFIVSSPILKSTQIDLAQAAIGAGGIALAWCSSQKSMDPAWIAKHLMHQVGVVTSDHLGELIETARLYAAIDGTLPPKVAIKKIKSEIQNRLVNGCKKTIPPIPLAQKAEKSHFQVTLATNGTLTLCLPNKTELDFPEPSTLVGALHHLYANHRPPKQLVPHYQPIDTEMVDMIARPPKRLLSETTSKKLIAAFGMEMPPETLCDTPSAALRFADAIDGPIVLKLIRPAFAEKSDHHGVLTGIEGPSNIRKSYQALVSLGKKLGPPPPLGILAAAHIEGGLRIWLKMVDHKKFGRILLVGQGDRILEAVDLVFPTSASLNQINRAVSLKWERTFPRETEQMARGIFQALHLMETLGSKIDQFEIHPMVARNSEPPIALDALIGISDK